MLVVPPFCLFMYVAGRGDNNFSLVARRDTLHLSEVTSPQTSQSRLVFTLAI
jgi:hypothetical protein